MILSIVSPLYYSAEYIEELCARVARVAQAITDDYEIILVNDCSPDESLKKSLMLLSAHRKLKVLDLAQHVGEHAAILAGMAEARGDYIFLVESDLEEEPEWLSLFWQNLHSDETSDVMYGVQKRRRGGPLERVAGEMFYRVVNLVSSVRIPANTTMSRLMTRRYANALLAFRNEPLNLDVLFALPNFNQRPLIVSKHSRSPSSYSLTTKLMMALTAMFSHASWQFFVFTLAGCLVLLGVSGAVVGSHSDFVHTVSFWLLLAGAILLLGLGLSGLCILVISRSLHRAPATVRQVYTSDKPKG
jgi:putative glycosyltransferase